MDGIGKERRKKEKIKKSWIIKGFASSLYGPDSTKTGGAILRCKE